MIEHPSSGARDEENHGDVSLDESDLDGDMSDPIAICGFSLKFPQDAVSPEAFWKMIMEKRCATTEFPANRLNPDGFYQEGKKLQTLPLRGAHFVKDDLSVFDAEFFSISPAEALAMDPMQRWLLEVAYTALENAGISMESISGSQTAVYTGSFSLDYMLQLCRDPECPPTYAAVGFGLSLLANRLSWFFNLHGPSIGLDSACSSTAMALDIACKALRDGSCSMAMVAGANIATSPESYIWMSNINFLSPDSRCYSFDHRGNGYARGEGIGVVVLKRLSNALRDGNTIRAVIRAAASNEDGRTPGITQPSSVAQERLIRSTYRKAGLSMKYTRFFEAHGTGTQAGDPREAKAIGSAFRDYRSAEDPLYIGAVKSNIGHLEGASGLAAVIKAVLVLEKGVIPPNTNFEKVNPRIDTELLRIKFPTEPQPWPTSGLRRASINSFGFGGANSHIVLDDAYNYLFLRSLQGMVNPRLLSGLALSKLKLVNGSGSNGIKHKFMNGSSPKLLEEELFNGSGSKNADERPINGISSDVAVPEVENSHRSNGTIREVEIGHSSDTPITKVENNHNSKDTVTEVENGHSSDVTSSEARNGASSYIPEHKPVNDTVLDITEHKLANGSKSDLANNKQVDGSALDTIQQGATSRLFVWSAADKGGIGRQALAYQEWYNNEQQSKSSHKDPQLLGNLAHTLSKHRSLLPWRSFAILSSLGELESLQSRLSFPIKAASKPLRIGFVFSGQGAQWFAMGRELLGYSSFREELEAATLYLAGLGCQWLVIDELFKSHDESKIDQPEYSQTICTVLQVAIVNLLRKFDLWPRAVVGHSSGEIAAAYAGGYLDRESAWKVAYFRGICSATLSSTESSQPKGSMMSVGLSQTAVADMVTAANNDATTFGVTVACVNSPDNVTLSGEDHLIDRIKAQLDEQQVFARKLRVDLAYHSRQMETVSAQYISMVGSLSGPENPGDTIIPMISSVTGKRITAKVLTNASYWVQNMVSPVRFSQAITTMCEQGQVGPKKIDRSHIFASVVDHLVEIGPHAALEGPIRQILRAGPRGNSLGYSSILKRGQSAVETMLGTLGNLHCMGLSMNFRSVNEPDQADRPRFLLVDLPEYPFDHSQHHWYESRLSQNYRFRRHAPSELLGVRSRDWNASDAKWRHFIRPKEMPWTEQHVVGGKMLYPGSGMLIMALEAAKQIVSETSSGSSITGYTFRDVHLEGPMDLAAAGVKGLEVQISLREQRLSRDDSGPAFEFTIWSYVNDDWRLNCRGNIRVELSRSTIPGDDATEEQTKIQHRHVLGRALDAVSKCQTEVDSEFMYSYLRINGYDYGPEFQAARTQRYNKQTRQAASQTTIFSSLKEDHLIHPASLDAILHLCFTAFTSGGSRPMATSIPSFISCLWLSYKGLSSPNHEVALTQSTIKKWTKRGFTCNGAAFSSADGGELRLWYEGLQMTNITAPPPSSGLPSPYQFCMSVETEVALNKLDNKAVQDLLGRLHPADDDNMSFWEDAEELIEISLERLASSVDLEASQGPGSETWKIQYSKWVQHHLRRLRKKRSQRQSDEGTKSEGTASSMASFQELHDRVANANDVGRLYATVAANLESLFRREETPLEMLMQTGLLKKYYAELCTYRCMWQAASYLGMASHQTPGMNILEVGGGTASATRKFLATLAGDDPRKGAESSAPASLRCSRYEFTDVSASFLDSARQEFTAYHSQMTFGTLDIERDFAEQGYEEGAYDVVVADGVLHVTYDLKQTLRNVRKALKPGGKLIMPELLKDDGWTAGFVFGLFPGWWFATNEDRHLSPNLSASDWGAVLRETGFSGSDVILTDFDADVAHHLGCVISTAIEPTDSTLLSSEFPEAVSPQPLPQPTNTQVTIIIDQNEEQQRSLADYLIDPLRKLLGSEPVVEQSCFSTPRQSQSGGEELVILLSDFSSSSFVASMNETKWTYMKSLVLNSQRILWVSAGGGSSDLANPEHGMLDGFTRTLRTEFYDLQLVLVALDITGSSTIDKGSVHLVQVAREMLARDRGASYEQEYIEISGLLHTRRLVEANKVKLAMDDRLMPYKERFVPVGEARFQLSTKTFSGTEDDKPNWIELLTTSRNVDFPRGQLEIKTKAVSLIQPPTRQSSTTATAPPIHHSGDWRFANFYAGVVSRIGSGVSPLFQEGDRVFGPQTYDLSPRSHLEVDSQALVRIPHDLSFEEACSSLPPTIFAYHALAEVAQVRPNHKILVHRAATQTGQASLRLLINRGVAEVWTVADSDVESAWVVSQLGIPQDHIIRQSWLKRDPFLMSQWKRWFDTVLVPFGEMDATLMGLVRPGGRFVVLRTASASSSSSSSSNEISDLEALRSLPGDISLSLIHAEYHRPSEESLRYAVESWRPTTSNENEAEPSHTSQQYAGSRLTKLVPHTKDVSDSEPDDLVKIRTVNKTNLAVNTEGTYVIAGGLGGLGRAMARWLVSRGARYLILLSRSGPQSQEAKDLMSECERKGVQVECPVCNVSDREALKRALDSCCSSSAQRMMPPIKGCIQSSMVMTERIFEQMDFSHWKATVDPKVQGSWNLHEELPRDLDFFVFISSMMGVLGSGSLTAYNAGNTYQDVLAAYRIARGEAAATLNLGAVPDAGYLIEHTHHIPVVLRAFKYAPTYVSDLCALLDMFCNPSELPVSSSLTPATFTTRHKNRHQVVVGIRPPAHWRHVEEVPWALQQPFWGHMHYIPPPEQQLGWEDDTEFAGNGSSSKSGGSSDIARRKRAADAVERLAATGGGGTLAEAAELVSEALALRVAALLGTAEDRPIDHQKPMHSYGLDSLTALDVRNWVAKVFGVDLPVFEILGGTTFVSAGAAIAQAVQHQHRK